MNRQRRSAVTLIETITAIMMLTIAIPPMLWAIQNAHIQRTDAVKASQARWLVTNKLEDIIADRHSTTRGYNYLIPGNYPAENPVSDAPGFTRSVSLVERQVNLVSAGTGFMVVTATVGWTDGKGQARTMAITTVLTEYDQ
jgi:Tfp pilus assembly protein PilV